MAVTDLDARYNRYTPPIVEKMRSCSGDCQRPAETVRERERLEMAVTDLDATDLFRVS